MESNNTPFIPTSPEFSIGQVVRVLDHTKPNAFLNKHTTEGLIAGVRICTTFDNRAEGKVHEAFYQYLVKIEGQEDSIYAESPLKQLGN
jgi:hypothetical protein